MPKYLLDNVKELVAAPFILITSLAGYQEQNKLQPQFNEL